MVGMCSFVALGVDVGRVAVARVQCQNAADVAAMAAVRQLNGDAATNNNYNAAAPAADPLTGHLSPA
jgi:Flp pilus assembly protein TadG